MDIDEELNKPKYKNWVRGAKCLEYLQEGLETFVGGHVVKHRDKTVQKITSALPHGSLAQCNLCRLENVLPEHAASGQCSKNRCKQNHHNNCFGSKPKGRRICPSGICSKMYDEIVETHKFKNPMWQNTDPSTWCSDPFGWSYAKCFQTTPNHGTCSSETDASGLLSIIINNTFFQNEVACSLVSNPNVFTSARSVRNEIMHRAKMELEEAELQCYIAIFIAVLTDQKTLLHDPAAMQAVEKLEKLKSDQITISLSDEIKLIQIRKEALSTLEKLEKKEKNIIEKIEKKKQAALAEIEDAKSDMQDKKQEAHREQVSAKSEVQIGKKMALEEIGEAKEAVFNELNEAKAEASEHTAALHEAVRKAEEAITQLTAKQQQLKMKQSSTIQHEASAGTSGKTSIEEERKEQAYLQMKTNLKDDLITFYRHNHRTIRLSPLLEEDAPLLKYYVTPVIKLVKLKTAHGCREEERIPVSSLHDMFYKEGKVYSEVYLSADAGLGKTSFSKRLALTWCQAKKPIEGEKSYFSKEDIAAMNEFDFLFLLLLRDCSNKCDIDGMILQQNTSRLAHVLSDPKDLESVLSRERCLIIIDGLDEWLHPPEKCTQGWSNIPHRNVREDVTLLTTTRPWKLSVLGSESSHVSHKLEIFGLDEDSAATLKKSVLSHLLAKSDGRTENKEETNKFVCSFNEELEKSAISDLEASPLLLMYLLFVWYYYKKLGNTQCEMYSEIIELLLSRTAQKPSNVKEDIVSIPHCYKNLKHCRQFYGFLTSLGKLAFKTLLKETKENTLVFDRIEAEQNLDNESLMFCLNSGILTQSKEYESLLRQKTKMAFSHKSVQEYFAALYMSSSTNQSSVLETVKSKCKCIKDMLEISKILLFISGINADMLSLISPELIRIVNDDEITREYRSSVEEIFYHPLNEYQDLWVSCCKEMSQENQASLCIEDVFIGYSCKHKQYRENLRLLTSRNQQNIKSVYIHMKYTPYKRTREVIDYFSLTRLDNLEKIWYRGYSDSDIAVLLKTSVKCLYLYLDSFSLDSPRLPCKEVTSLNKLEVIDIHGCTLSHSELTEFYNYICRTKCLRKIRLEVLLCTDHAVDCPGSRLELLQHSQLRTLSLWYIPVTEIEINLAILEKCKIEGLYYPVPVLRFRNNPAADNNLPGNTRVVLDCVTMAASSLRQLVDLIQKLPQSVLVEINKCTIKPEDEFRRQIHRIKTSSQFRMLKDLGGTVMAGKHFSLKQSEEDIK